VLTLLDVNVGVCGDIKMYWLSLATANSISISSIFVLAASSR
jgi:hypothetical protein